MSDLLQEIENNLAIPHPRMVFEPVLGGDSDELSQAIDEDVHVHENDWDLKELPDAEKLGSFWDEVLSELGPERAEQDDE
jgi:hypothetical protein